MLTSLRVGVLIAILEFLYHTQVSLILVANSCNGENECKSWFINDAVFPLNQIHRNSLTVRRRLNRTRPTPITCTRIITLRLVVLIKSPRQLLNSITHGVFTIRSSGWVCCKIRANISARAAYTSKDSSKFGLVCSGSYNTSQRFDHAGACRDIGSRWQRSSECLPG